MRKSRGCFSGTFPSSVRPGVRPRAGRGPRVAQNDGRQGRGRRCPDPCPRSALGRAAGSAASSPCGQAPGSRDPPGRKPGLRLFAHAPRPRPESTAVPSVRGPRVSHLSSATVRKHQREKSVVNDFYVSDRAPFCAVRRHLVPSALGACDSLRAVWRPRARPPRPHQLARVTVLLSRLPSTWERKLRRAELLRAERLPPANLREGTRPPWLAARADRRRLSARRMAPARSITGDGGGGV